MRRILGSLLLAATMFVLLPVDAAVAQEEEEATGYGLAIVIELEPADRAAYRSALETLAGAAAEAGATTPWWAWSHDLGYTVVLGIDSMAWFDDSDSFWGQFPESAQADFRQALNGFDRVVTSEVTQQVKSWSYMPENPMQDIGMAHVHHDWLKAGAQEAYGELSEKWVAFLGKIGYPYQVNCMRTVVGAQKTTCVTFADNLSQFTSDATWDDLIAAAGAEEEFAGLLEEWQGLVLRWEHMDASYVSSMSYWPEQTD